MPIAEPVARGLLLVASRKEGLDEDGIPLSLSCPEGVKLETSALKDFAPRAGHELPDFLVLAPGSGLLARVRSHPALSLLPCFRLGREEAAPDEPWDGNLFEVGGAILRRCTILADRVGALTKVEGTEGQAAFEHRLLRFVASRGRWHRQWAPVFGLPGFLSLESSWVRKGWLQDVGEGNLQPTPALFLEAEENETPIAEENETQGAAEPVPGPLPVESDSTLRTPSSITPPRKERSPRLLPSESSWPRVVAVAGVVLLLPIAWKLGALSFGGLS
jgi:hypothetical protein